MTLLDRLGGRQAIMQGVEETFRLLSRHPHPSHGEELTCRDYAAFLREKLGAEPVEDSVHNLMCTLPASPGWEGRPTLILQGHMDMVCACAGGFRPESDAVNIVSKDGFLRSDGRSSLGADNGLGNAAVLWLLSTGQVAHGPLTLLFTTAEEVGLAGAKEVDPAWLAGSDYLLNTDGFHLGRAIVGSAGGRRETWSRPLETEGAPALPAWRITLTGGLGGHSGDDIHRGRGNPIKLLAGYLTGLPGGRIASLSGGLAHNAIPAQAEAVVFAPKEPDLNLLNDALELYREADPGLHAECVPTEGLELVWTAAFQAHALALLNGLYHGVYAMDPAFPGVVGASANLGKVEEADGTLQVCTFLRAARQADNDELAQRHEALAKAHGFTGTVTGYPGWPGDRDNPLAAVLDGVWRQQTGHSLEIGAVHVGLEPSVFQAKAPGLVMASTGPDILDAHSVDERAPLDTIPDYVLLLAGTLEAL